MSRSRVNYIEATLLHELGDKRLISEKSSELQDPRGARRRFDVILKAKV